MKLSELEALRARLALHDAEAAFHALPHLLEEREMLLEALRPFGRDRFGFPVHETKAAAAAIAKAES